mgnify:CR=1 FL=1
MVVSADSTFAMRFNGISDAVVIPMQGISANASSLQKPAKTDDLSIPGVLDSFTFEAWVIPDSGGIVWEYEHVMRLVVGAPSSSAPASFQVKLREKDTGNDNTFSVASALPITKPDGTLSHFDGVVFPRPALDIHDSYDAADGSKSNNAAVHDGHRELLQVSVVFDKRLLSLRINGDVVATQILDTDHELVMYPTQVFIGGQGGEFRGVIEAIHWATGNHDSSIGSYAPINTDTTIGLWRFEEPVEPISTILSLPSLSASTSASSSISIGTTTAQSLIDTLSGQSGLTTLTLTSSPYSAGNYTVDRHTAGSTTTVSVPQVPFNLLINPLGYNRTTGVPNREAPERVRITAIDASAGTMTVESIHLDYASNASTGRRGLLMAHSASDAVIITGDCLIDGGTGAPYQSKGTGTQFSNKQAQVVIDESQSGNHGIVFSTRMSIIDDPYMKFSATTNMGTSFTAGHTGRHILNHVDSHPFIGMLPRPTAAEVEHNIDGSATVMNATFAPHFANIFDAAPANSVVSFYDVNGTYSAFSTDYTAVPRQVVENGMAGITDASRDLLALAIPNVEPFLLRSGTSALPVTDGDEHIRHMTPSKVSRIAVLEVPSLATHNRPTMVQIHYNAIDMIGTGIKHATTARLSSGISGSGTVLTFPSVKQFGPNGGTIPADFISIEGEVAGANSIVATISHSGNTLTFGSAATGAFRTAAVANAIVNVHLNGAAILVEKTYPDVGEEVTSGTRIIDLIHTDVAAGNANLHSAGGIIRFLNKPNFPFKEGELNGDDEEGYQTERALDFTMCPDNYLPLHSSDSPQQNPQRILSTRTSNTNRDSVFNRLVVVPSADRNESYSVDNDSHATIKKHGKVRESTGVFVNNGGGYSGGTTSITVDGATATNFFAAGSKVYSLDGVLLGTVNSSNSTTVVLASGSTQAVVDNEELFYQPLLKSTGTASQSSAVHEIFDIVSHSTSGRFVELVVQPTQHSRFTQLSRLYTVEGNSSMPSNKFEIHHLMGRGRALSLSDADAGTGVLRAHGLGVDLAANSVSVKGDGAPDSFIVKETMPGAPVVTVTLGGAGQGAINTKPTYVPSPTARLGWSTRRDCSTRVTSTSSTTVVVAPLNNKSSDLASWGTYCFPKTGRIYFATSFTGESEQPRYASAEYASKTGTTFTFSSGSQIGSGKFLLADGTEKDTFADWITATLINVDNLIEVDDKFSEESICNDGTTVNDRLFQTLDSVQHDYQLGTQYASTRAMVEIPLFDDFFFEDAERGIFPGPDNSMKLHLDATYAAPTWAPNPVGRRPDSVSPEDPTVNSAFSNSVNDNTHRRGTVVSRKYDASNRHIYVQDYKVFSKPTAAPVDVASIDGSLRFKRAFLPSGEWVIYDARNTSGYLEVAGNAAADDAWAFSKNFLNELSVGVSIMPASGYQDMNYTSIGDNPLVTSAGFESRKPYYHDRANTMTQGGNVDYGMKQYVSAVEFRAGPRSNPHLARIKNKRARTTVKSFSGTTLVLDDITDFPKDITGDSNYSYRVAYYDSSAAAYKYAHYNSFAAGNSLSLVGVDTGFDPSVGDEIILWDVHSTTGTYPETKEDMFLNTKWANPYSGGGLREGDSVWMNMHYTNPHAIEGLFCKSRGTLDEGQVWSGFLEGEGSFTTTPRDSIPMENFLIGNTCIETARNFVQHINKTIEMNYEALGLYTTFTVGGASYNNDPTITHSTTEKIVVGMGVSGSGIPDGATVATVTDGTHFELSVSTTGGSKSSQTLTFTSQTPPPVVAYIDPYQATEEHARVLLYDVAHDREFIAFQDLWMQVQSSPQAATIGSEAAGAGAIINTKSTSGTGLDVANGFTSQSKYLTSSTASEFMEGAMAHKSTWNLNVAISAHATSYHGHTPADTVNGRQLRTNEAVVTPSSAASKHQEILKATTEDSTFFDTPDGTRCIPVFLALKGIRTTVLDLSTHEESRLQHLPHWTNMDFVRRLSIDFGEIGVKDGIRNIEAAAREIVRLINQAGAANGRTHAKRPADQYFGESERFNLSNVGVRVDSTNSRVDPTATHLHADFAATGSTHDPAPFWDKEKAFAAHDRGTHMGYMRAHLGRVVADSGGKKGYSIVIHSTVPGASGRNFCVWLDNSRGQMPYRPQFLIGHGGRFRNYWCQPDEITGENMHPAPMPINRFGRPFAPITTLKEYLPSDEVDEPFRNNLEFGPETTGTAGNMASSTSEIASGRNSNTIIDESFETKSPSSQIIDGLRIGTPARARINFGGLTQAGIPGWAPDAGKWGFGRDQQDTRFEHIYGNNATAFAQHGTVDATTTGGYIPDSEIRTDNIGDGQLYGIRFVDHLGKNYTIRMVYRQHGQNFANDLTILPPTLDNEILIHFDDRDTGQGGFSVGKHMFGEGDVCGEFTAGAKKKFKGNLWNNYPSPASGIEATVQKVTVSGADALKIVFAAPYDTSSTLDHPDILGYLGLPESGVIQVNDCASGATGNNGEPFYYESRTHYPKAGASGAHYLYRVEGNTSAYGSALNRIISPRIAFTCLLTDEVIAAAVEYAMTMDDPNSSDITKTSFDCTSMLAPDGRTLREWGVSPTAIRIKTHSPSTTVTPLKHLFDVSREKDWGLQAGASVQSTGTDHLGGLTATEISEGARLDVGYIPKTVLHITTKYRGTNANTATPVLVDSMNNVVDTSLWKQNLRGDTFYRTAGDRIIPCVYSPMIDVGAETATTVTVPTNDFLWLITTPASDDANSWGEKFRLWRGSEDSGIVFSKPGATSHTQLEFSADMVDWDASVAVGDILVRQGSTSYAFETDGVRRAGSYHGEPFLYFRGAHDSPDHWVPLYFGGGFSGVTLDVNDGTQNDYSEFYEHPYSGGPTGSAGLQNVGEVAGSHALIDANAMLAMFPGTPYLDQHEGRNSMPFFNQDAMLSFDLDAGNSSNASSTGVTYTDGTNTVRCQRPSPIVLRFAHPHARYSAAGATDDHTTYMIFGPGQAVPHNFAAQEPQLSGIVTAGNGYSAVPTGKNLPNEIANGGPSRLGFSAHLPPTAEWQKTSVSGYNYVMNWEPSKGHPNSTHFAQTAGQGMFYDSQFTDGTPPAHAQPTVHVFKNYANVFMGASGLATTLARSCIWHMDGGYHPGGHILDNHIERNPKHPTSATRLGDYTTASKNPSVFRVSSLLATAYLGTFDSAGDMTSNTNYIVIDATRVQNAEELGAVVSAGINTFPGTDPLKAIGGTFLPSFQTAAKQDRYGWVELTLNTNGYTAESGAAATVQATTAIPTTLPQYGWLRVTDGGAVNAVGSYTSFSSSTFTLGKNDAPVASSANTNLVIPTTKADADPIPINGASPTGNIKIYVWTKAGTHRYNNTSEARDHMTQVHFNGYIDAVDRTKPIGAVGWSGEAYSYLNSYNNTTIGSTKFPAGKGAWHPFLGFNPYGAAETCLSGSSAVGADSMPASVYEQQCEIGLSSRHLIAVTHESEMPLIAKADRDGILCAGDWLDIKRSSNLTNAGTTQWDTAKVHNRDRYVGPATAGPHVEAMMLADVSSYPPTASYPAVGTETYWHSRVTAASHIERADPCQSPTGDLFWDKSKNRTAYQHEDEENGALGKAVECKGIQTLTEYSAVSTGLYKFYDEKQAARNFNEEHVVWKRMDGGNLTMPAVNARGLGMVPWVYRKDGSSYKKVGETILGNNRFSFETTNGAMFPVIQAQELSHPQLAEQNKFKVQDALLIPNEEQQFQSLQVLDDTGQEHRLAGGSPLGTVILDFRHLSNREVEGLSPALAGSGISPNLKIRLPEADEIPGNIIVRPSFDRIQGYQTETMGSGGLQHPSQPQQAITDMFNDAKPGPRAWPTWENNGWEHLSQDGTDVSATRLSSPDSSTKGWSDHTNNNPLETAYEPHDRSLQFHITRMGVTMTHRDDVDELSFTSLSGTEINVGSTPEDAVWKVTTEQSGSRWFLRVYDPTTNKGVIASYTNTGSSKFTGVVVSPDFETFISGKTGLKVVPSYYMPAGSTRFFASRRLRDHSEYSGSSPDMANIAWQSVGSTPYAQLTAPKMTPMPIPRMGHHYVTPTMALAPGHYAHPAYQRMYDLHLGCRSAAHKPLEDSQTDASIRTHVPGRDPLIWFSGSTAAYGPSDIHGGAFTLMTETKVKYDGYGIAAASGSAGTVNSQGGHSIVLEAAGTYTLDNHFPDPMEVGAYQIVIQPNVFSQQITGYHLNHSDAAKAPSESGTKVVELTGQQVNTVIAIEHDKSSLGGMTLVLAEATMADIRGCEIIINEVMLDMEPDSGSQFTNIPTLGLYNPLGVEETTSPAFTRRSLPYRTNMFIQTTPGMTVTVPWWSQLHKDGATDSKSDGFRSIEWHTPDHYYQMNRPSFGAVGAQITLAGLPTIYPDIYGEHYRLRSLNPNAVITGSAYTASTARITVDDGDAASGMTEKETMVITSSDGTARTYVIVDDNATAVATGDVLASSSDTGASTAGTALVGGIAVAINLTGSVSTQNAFLVQLKAAIEHANGHNGKITVSAVPAEANGAQFITLTSAAAGPHDNTAITDDISQTVLTGFSGGVSTLSVDNCELFPVEPYYNEVLEYTDTTGTRQTASYVNRVGTLAHATLAAPVTFQGVQPITAGFFTNLVAGTILRLSGPYDNRKAGDIFKDSEASIATRTLPQTMHGTRDTNSLHTPDAYMCMWHPNLGRPYTYYSDNASRNFYAATGVADTPVNQEALNHVPEHFESVHYHDFFYAASKGPFGLGMRWLSPAGSDALSTDGTTYSADEIDRDANLSHQGGTTRGSVSSGVLVNNGSGYAASTTGAMTVDTVDATTKYQVGDRVYNSAGKLVGVITALSATAITIGAGTTVALANNEILYLSEKYNFGGFWPGGSRGGAGSSRLDGFLEATIGWGGKLFGLDCVGFHDSSGVAERTFDQMTTASDYERNHCFGYRFSVRQPYNRPRWSPYIRGWLEGTGTTNALLGYYHGSFIQQDNKSSGWDYVGADSEQADADFPATYTGILERLTQITALLNQDQIGRQVRYSDGRRMTQSFGCPVRTVRNGASVRRMYPNDHAGLDISELAAAHRYYLIDWWGNTRGEDVRRFPVRGFGIRPAWDPEDAYADTNVTHRPAAASLFGGDGTDRYSGNANNDNNASSNMGTADWFNPASAMRVGDRGDGRGVRWPTLFNESLLGAVSQTVEPTGLVVSQPTAEPTVGKGLIRPRNDVLQSDETERGISNRLDLADEDGLLKPTAMVSEGIESVTADSMLAEPVGGDGVRIGLDIDTLAELNDGVSREYVIMSTEAHSLHTDREVGQRTTLRGALNIGSQTLGHLDMTSLSWSGQPVKGVLRVSNAHAFWALGGTYVVDWSVREGVLSDFGWGSSTLSLSNNPYQDANHSPKVDRTNNTDSSIEFLMRPVMTLDKSHVQMFRHNPVVTGSTPQASPNFYSATGGCKYGFYVSDAPSARTGTPSSPPYKPVYSINPASSVTSSAGDGPKILGVDFIGIVTSGVLINNGGGYAANTTGAMTVDTVSATDHFAVGDSVYNSSTILIGIVTAVTTTSVTIGAGTNVSVANDEALYKYDLNTTYIKTDITQPVARIVMSENTLEHFRSDAPRRLSENGESDFTVQPRHSQTLHPKGSSGDTSFNTGDHSGE